MPNIVLVVLDDMSGSDWAGLPRTARMVASKGAWYPNFIVNTPTCGPSRATLLTGQLPHNHKVFENSGEDAAWPEFMRSPALDKTLQACLRPAGYRTAVFGKFLNGSPDTGPVGPDFDEWYASNRRDYYDFSLNENGQNRSYSGSDYSTDVLAAKAVRFIRDAPGESPLFLLFGPRAPKVPAFPAPRHQDRFPGVTYPRTAAWNEIDASDKPETLRDRTPVLPDEEAGIDADYRARLCAMLSVDDAIATIAQTLRKTRPWSDTIFIVVTDNGYAMGEHRLVGKGHPYDVMVRCPMAAWGPGIPARVTDQRLVGMTDIAATLESLTGVRGLRTDGIPFNGTLRHQSVIIEKKGGSQPFAALRSVNELYVENDNGEREYYDYRIDPLELENRLATWNGKSPTLDPTRERTLQNRLAVLRQCRLIGCI